MNQKVIDFLNKEHIGVLSITLPDGDVHGASLHFSHSKDLKFYFSTERRSRKCTGIRDGSKAKASLVVGTSETEWKTVQMSGIARGLTDEEEIKVAKEIYYGKHPGSKKWESDPETFFIEFTPTWWRYSDLSNYPPEIITE